MSVAFAALPPTSGCLAWSSRTGRPSDGFRFVLYDKLWDSPIRCDVREEDRDRVIEAFGKRVEVYGSVRYRRDGRPTTVTVDDFMVFPCANELPKARDVEGILRDHHRG